MFYPTEGVTEFHPQWVPEFFGDVAVVNAKIWPYVDVEPRRYRLRIVNGSQSRVYNLQFANESTGNALAFTQIGAEGGLLRAPVPMTALLIAPGERADVIIDFAGQSNASFIVTNNARGPPSQWADVRGCRSSWRSASTGRCRSDTTTPAANLQLPALPFLPAPSVTRVQHLSETLDPLTGNPINLNVEDAPYLDDDTHLPEVTANCQCRRGLASRQHDGGHASDPPAPRDLRGHQPQAVLGVRSGDASDHLHGACRSCSSERKRTQGHGASESR